MFSDLLNRYELKLGEKKKVILTYSLIFLSLLCTEILYQHIIMKEITNLFVPFITSFFFAGIVSLIYLIIPKIRYILLILGGILYNLIVLFFSIVYDLNGFVPSLVEISYETLLSDVFTRFNYTFDYLLYLVPIVILLFVPRRFEFNFYPRLKTLLNLITLPYLLLLISSFIPYKITNDTYYEKYFTTRNNNFISYHYGSMFTLLNNLIVDEASLTNYEIDNLFKEDTIPNSGYNSKAYQGKNFVLIDVMGLDYQFINEEVMPFLANQLKTSTYSVNFYSVPTPLKEQAYFMMDTGLYYDVDNPYNLSYEYSSVRDHNLTKVFKNNGYKTYYFTNSNDYSYRYGKLAGFDDVSYYDTNTLTVMNEAMKKMTKNKAFYTKITLGNEKVLDYKIEERFKGEDELISHYKGHMDEVNIALNQLFVHLLNEGILDKTIICIFNSSSDTRLYSYVNENTKDNSRVSYDFYKSPLIFLDGGASENYVYSSYVDFYSGICDAFGLSKADLEKSSGISIFHNPIKAIRFMDGSVVSEEFIYYAKYDSYKVKKLEYLTPATLDILKNKISYTEKMYKLSQNLQKNYYFHLNSV